MKKLLSIFISILLISSPAYATMNMAGRSGLSKKGLATYLSTPYAQTLVVSTDSAKSNYTTITSALAAITDASTSKRYCIKVMPGTYSETFTCKAYVDIVGTNLHDVIITQANTTIVTAASNVLLKDLTIQLTAAIDDKRFITYTASAALTDFTCDNVYFETTGDVSNYNYIAPADGNNASYTFRRCIFNNLTNAKGQLFFSAGTGTHTVLIEDCHIITSHQGIGDLEAVNGTYTIKNCYASSATYGIWLTPNGAGTITVNSYNSEYLTGSVRLNAGAGETVVFNSYGDTIASVSKGGGAGTETFNNYSSKVLTESASSSPQIIVVDSKTGSGDFTTISAALTAITDAATGKRYCIKVMPGTYDEAVTMEDFVDIQGSGWWNTIITRADSNVITGASNTRLSDLTVEVQNDTVGRVLYGNSVAAVANVFIEDCRFQVLALTGAVDSEYIRFSGATSQTDIYIRNCTLYGTSSIRGYGIEMGNATASATRVYVENCRINDLRNCIVPSYIGAAAANVDFNVKNCYISSGYRAYVLSCGTDNKFNVLNSYNNTIAAGDVYLTCAATRTVTVDSYGDKIVSVTKAGGGGTETFNSYGSQIGGVFSTGVYSAGAATDSTGYITIIDQTGTTRKVMIQA